MPPTFYVHRNATSSIGSPWGWVTRDLAGDGPVLGFWRWKQPEPGCCPGARVEWYIASTRVVPGGVVPDVRCRVVAPSGFAVVFSIPDLDTARELLAWLCPPKD